MLFEVDGDAEALTRTPLATMDQTRKQAKLEFSGVPARLIGTENGGGEVLGRVLDLAVVALAAEQVGGHEEYSSCRSTTPRTGSSSPGPSARSRPSSTIAQTTCLEVESAKSAAYYAAWCATPS